MMRRNEWERKNKICYLFFILIFFFADVASFSLPYVKQWSPTKGHSCLQKSGYCSTISFRHIWRV